MSTPSPFDEGGGDDAALDIAPVAEPTEKPALAIVEGGKPAEKPAEARAEEKPADDWQGKYNNLQAALREEREKNRAEREAMRAKLAEFDQVRDELRANRDAQREAKRQEDEAARLQADPVAYFKDRADAQDKRLQEFTQAAERQTAEQAEQTRFLTAVTTQVQAFQREHADYNDALQYAYAKRMGEYEIMGIPAELRDQQFAEESLALSRQALMQGRNPAEVVYGLAKAWGFATPAPAAAKPAAEQQIEREANGQFAARTLSKPGTTGEESLLKRIEDMDDDEFDKFWKTDVAPSKGRR